MMVSIPGTSHGAPQGILALATWCACVALAGCSETSSDPPGKITVESDRYRALEGGYGDLISVQGKSLSAPPDQQLISVVHVLLLTPSMAIRGNATGWESLGIVSRHWIRWEVEEKGTVEFFFDLDVDGEHGVVTLTNRSFSLDDGNFFLVSFDSDWQPTVAQAAAVDRRRSVPAEVVAAFRDAFPTQVGNVRVVDVPALD
jgi:hypothetical protein